MATTETTNATGKSSNTAKIVDAALWWEPFSDFLAELENASVTSEIPPSLEKKLKDHHVWFSDTIAQFRSPNQKSREALDSPCIKIGMHELNVQPELKDTALKISPILSLDEVQSYILVKRSLEHDNASVSDMDSDILNTVMLEYYTERQCLLKCTRQILMHALQFGSESDGGSSVLKEAQRLISDGLECKLLNIFQDLLTSNYPENMDFDLYTLWAEETLIEDNLILDTLFLVYYESFCTCDAKCWKRLCGLYEGIVTGSYNFQKLAISPDAVHSIYHAKVQLLFILIEALNLETLLQMIHDNISFRQGSIGFSEIDVQQMDVMISSFNAFEAKEEGPLILAWAVFLCLISSLPEKEENMLLMELDHVGYVRQAFEASSLEYFLEILQSDTLKYSDGPLAGYRSVLRTFISAFIASYEISLQFEDDNLKLILEILCKVYKGEESLCIQFWDKGSFIDGPVRCLLCNLEGEFPFRTVELVRLLSALCEGAWPSECVFNFLDKSVGLSTPLGLRGEPVVDAVSKIVETLSPLHVTGFGGLVIPSKSRGQVLRMIDENCGLVRWEYTESGVVVLLLRLAQELYVQNPEERIVILDLLSRLVNFNMAVCYSLMNAWDSFHGDELTIGSHEKYVRIDVVEIVCALVKSLSPSVNGAVMMSMGVNILTKMLRCMPSRVATMIMKGNIFDVALRSNSFDDGSNSLSSGSWLLSGRLAKMLLIDCEQTDCSMTLSVLDFTMNLLETGLETDAVLALIVFSLQYVLVNHEFWNYKVKHARWKVTLKVLEVMKKFLPLSLNQQKLYVSRLFDIRDIEGLQLAISAGLDVLVSMMSVFSKMLTQDSPSLSVFHQAILSPMTKPIRVISAAVSLISYTRSAIIQVGAARLLSLLFIADFSQSNASLSLDDKEIVNFRKSICVILSEQPPWDEDLIVATLNLLTSAALNEPAFLVAVFSSKENMMKAQVCNAGSQHRPNNNDNGSLVSKEESLLYAILQYLKKCEDLFDRNPKILLCLLNLLRALWQGAPQFTKILEQLKVSDKFWKQLTSSAVLFSNYQGNISEKLTEKKIQSMGYRYQFMSDVLDILNYEIFLQKKLMHAEIVVNRLSKSPTNETEKKVDSKDGSLSDLKEIISSWCKGSLLSDLIKAFVSWEYDDSHMRAKVSYACLVLFVAATSPSPRFKSCEVAASLFAVHAMVKLRSGDKGSFSVYLIERVITLSQKLCKLPAFSELLTQYGERGYSGGQELENLVLSDLFYHIQGELEGRQIDNRPFKELLQFLSDSEFLNAYKNKQDDDLLPNIKSVYLYDTVRLQADLGVEMWDLLAWIESKELSEDEASTGLRISEPIAVSCINHTCLSLRSTIELLTPIPVACEDVLDILTAQAELLELLTRSLTDNFPHPTSVLILNTSGYGLKVLCGCMRSLPVGTPMKFLLMLILSSVELSCKDLHSGNVVTRIEDVEASAEASNSCLGLLPVLCNCIEHPDHCTLSLTAIDLILKSFSASSTWSPVIQKHLPLQHIVQKLQEETSSKTVSVILKFLLNLARVRQGAEMLLNAGVLESLRMLLSDFSDGGRNFSDNKTEKCESFWGLSLAVITAIIQSLGDSSSARIVDYVMTCILVEKAPLVSYYLSAPDFPSEGHENKRARALKSNISLSELKETQNTLALICVLARYWNSWKKLLQSMESQLREKSIHLLAFISRATQRPGELSTRDVPLLCRPVVKEEFEWYKEKSFINSRNGWFALSALGCKLDLKRVPSSSAIVLRDLSKGDADTSSPQTYLSDLIAIEMYRIAYLLLKFLCIQAESAARRAEEVGFVDHAHFPELPMPEILHGLQDQGIGIITELCEANKTKQLAPEIQGVCLLLLQVTVMALYLEFCVIQICGIRPVLGHVETFSKELRLLIRATEGHVFLKEPLKDLKQIVAFVYPELIQQEDLF
ncbi:nucleoporin nup188 homolog [Phtheirospermum japonicum]|uniref:Nucleoporin nup188 homolog n=1 Tax=Phtheirospermum japonicum TaxID=374723 RepID=A0A830BQA5_9LAMI|nr:nucleoporin nup188 homolog [Phtheirospermum japonicum]